MARRKVAMKAYRPRNLLSMVTVSVIVVMLIVVLKINCSRLEDKKAVYIEKEKYLIEQIAQQEKRAAEIEEFRQYTLTKQFIEDIAKERLGLVYKDEIIFEAEN